MGWRQRARLPAAVKEQQNRLILGIDAPTRHELSRIVEALVKSGNKSATPVTPTVPALPPQEIIPGGILSVSYGTITITSGLELVWSNGVTTEISTGFTEAFVLNDIVYVTDIENACYRRFGTINSPYDFIGTDVYTALKATAKKVITPAVAVQ